MSTQAITQASLNEIPYHKLKDELEKHGLASCWRGGVKKVDVIKDALSKLGIVKQLQEEGKSQEEIDKHLEIVDAKKEQQVQLQEQQEEQEQEQEQEQLKEQSTVEDKVDVETLQLQLRMVKGNLKSGPPSHKAHLLKRKAQLIEILKQEGVEVE